MVRSISQKTVKRRSGEIIEGEARKRRRNLSHTLRYSAAAGRNVSVRDLYLSLIISRAATADREANEATELATDSRVFSKARMEAKAILKAVTREVKEARAARRVARAAKRAEAMLARQTTVTDVEFDEATESEEQSEHNQVEDDN